MPPDEDIIDHCTLCNKPMDVSALAPFSNVVCPSCNEHTRVKLKFGPYQLTRRHAAGGMSMVFAAHDNTLNREVAVKILSEEFSKDETRITAFEEEARITASFSHPNVVRVLRTGHAFGRFYIAMEMVSGGHFEHHIKERGRIPEEDVLPLAIEVAHGLKAAKAAGLIHRDVKPGNILLDSDGHAKLVDFGLALVTHEGQATASELWATPYYVPPETVEGKEEDFRSDIYAFGATLYHALAGTPSCNEECMSTDILLKAKQEIVPLGKMAPQLSEEICEIVDKSMAYNRDDRYTSYDALIRQLKNALSVALTGTSEPKKKSAARKRQKRRLTVIIAASVLAILGISVWALNPPDPYSDPDIVSNPNSNGGGEAMPKMPHNAADIAKTFQIARAALKKRNFPKASKYFDSLLRNPSVQEPSRSWAGIEATICQYLDGDPKAAQRQASATLDHIQSLSPEKQQMTQNMHSILKELHSFYPIEPKTNQSRGAANLITNMLAGLKNWEQGQLEPASKCFQSAVANKLTDEDRWASTYLNLTNDYLHDYKHLTGSLFTNLPDSRSGCDAATKELNDKLKILKTQGRARYNVRAWQLDIARHKKLLD